MLINQTIEQEFVEPEVQTSLTKLSAKSWSLNMQDVSFTSNFGNFFNRILNRSEKVGYLTIAYDYGCYFPKAKLNLNFSKEIVAVRPCDRLNMGVDGKVLFPEKKVNDCLQVGMFFFNSRMDEMEYKVLQLTVRELIRKSDVLSEIESICHENKAPEKEKLDKMKDELFRDIEEAINESKSSLIHTFDLQFPVEKEWTFFGIDRQEKAEIEIQLNKNIC